VRRQIASSCIISSRCEHHSCLTFRTTTNAIPVFLFERRENRSGKQVQNKIERIEQKWRESHNFVTSATGEGIRENSTDQSWEDKVKKKNLYYYDLADVFLDRAANNPKATSDQITAAGFSDSENSSTKLRDDDDDDDPVVEDVDAPFEAVDPLEDDDPVVNGVEGDHGDRLEESVPQPKTNEIGSVPTSVVANLEDEGRYATPTVRSRLTSESASSNTSRKTKKNTAAKKSMTSHKKSKSGNNFEDEEFNKTAMEYMKRRMVVQSAAPVPPKSKFVCPAEKAAKMSQYFRTCVDNFGSRVLAAWSCDDFVKYLTPSEERELLKMKADKKELNQTNVEDRVLEPTSADQPLQGDNGVPAGYC
jgi:hypothetical protein